MRRLILRPGAIGDCILSLPALEHLLTDYTEVWISTPVVPLIRFADRVTTLSATGIDLVGLVDVEFPATLRATLERFDSIVSWYGTNRPEFQDALRGLDIPCQFLAALPPDDYPGHAAQFFAGQVGAELSRPPRIETRLSAQRNSIVIHPYSGSTRKNWPLERYRELARRLPLNVEWTAGPEEDLPGARRFENLAELAAWLSGARLYIGNDSGITHLAAAVGIPTLALFGPTDPAKWGPLGPKVTILKFEQLNQLDVELVLRAVNRLLR